MGRLLVRLFGCILALQAFVAVLFIYKLFFESPESDANISLQVPIHRDVMSCLSKSNHAWSAYNRSKSKHCKRYFVNLMCNDTSTKPLAIHSKCPHKKNLTRTPLPLGCYALETDLLSSFVLSESKSSSDCVRLCQLSGVRYAFTSSSGRCGCRQQLPTTGSKLSSAKCTVPCRLRTEAKTSIPLCGTHTPTQITDTFSVPPLHQQPVPLSRSNMTADVLQPVRLVYLLVWHGRSWFQMKQLFQLIFHPRHYYYIHVDSRSEYLYHQALSLAKRYPNNVYVTERRWTPIWGGTDLLWMMLSAMRQLIVDLGSKWHWDFLINLSGSDLPIRPQQQLITYLSQQRDKIFLHSNPNRPQFILSQGLDHLFANCDQYAWDLGPRPLPTGLVLDGGSDWMVLPRSFVEYVTFTEDALFKELVDYFRYSLLPVETFFHILAQNTHFCDSVVAHALRFNHWDRPRGCECKYGFAVDWCGCSPVAFRGLKGAEQLCARVGDCLGYSHSNEPVFFARKFDPTVDMEVMEFVIGTMLGQVSNSSIRQFYRENIYSGELEAAATSSYLRLILPAILEAQFRQINKWINHSTPITLPPNFHNGLNVFALFNATQQRLIASHDYPAMRLHPPKLVLLTPVHISSNHVSLWSPTAEFLIQPPSLLWTSQLPVSQIAFGDVIYLEVATNFDGKEQLTRNYPRILTTVDTLQLIIMWKGESNELSSERDKRTSTLSVTVNPVDNPTCVGHSIISLVVRNHTLIAFDCPSCYLLVLPLTTVLHNCSLIPGMWRLQTVAVSGQTAQTDFFLFPVEPVSPKLLSSSPWSSIQASDFCVNSAGIPSKVVQIPHNLACSTRAWSAFVDGQESDLT